MGKVDSLTINLDKSTAIYKPGETLSGSLFVKVKDRIKINLIKVKVYGGASTFW